MPVYMASCDSQEDEEMTTLIHMSAALHSQSHNSEMDCDQITLIHQTGDISAGEYNAQRILGRMGGIYYNRLAVSRHADLGTQAC